MPQTDKTVAAVAANLLELYNDNERDDDKKIDILNTIELMTLEASNCVIENKSRDEYKNRVLEFINDFNNGVI